MPKKIANRLKIIKSIKYFCLITVLITIVVISYYILVNQNNKIRQDTSIKSESSNKNEAYSQISSPDLIGISLEHGPYYIKAEEMQEFSGYVEFRKPKVDLMMNHLDWLNVVSSTAKLTKSDNHLQLFDDIKANFNKHYYFSGEQAEIIKDESVIRSDHYSKLFTNEYNLESDSGFIINYQNQTAFFSGKINVDIKRAKDSISTNIKSNKLDIFWLKKTGHFLGNVILTRDGTKVEADKMNAIINKKTDELEKIHAYGNVKITDKENIATGEYGEYIVATEILTLKDRVKLYKNNNEMSGELLHYNFINKKANLVGSSKTKNGRVRAVIIPTKKHE